MVPAIAPRFFVGRSPAPYAGAVGWGPYGPPSPGWRPAPVSWGPAPKPYPYGPYAYSYGPAYPWVGPAYMPYGAAWGFSPYSPWAPGLYGTSTYSTPAPPYAYAPAYSGQGYPYGGWLSGSLAGGVPLVPPVMPVWHGQGYRQAPRPWPQALPPPALRVAEPVLGVTEMPRVPINAEPATEELA